MHGAASTQQNVYDDVGAPILDAAMQGYNGTILAYGQTGAGKTHTLLNASGENSGLVPRLIASLYVAIGIDVRTVYTVRASFAQIYNEQIDDLIKPKNSNLKLRAGGHEVEGLSLVECKSAEEMLQLLEMGRKNLVYAETKLNKTSSRSHAVLQIFISRRQRVLDAVRHGPERPRPLDEQRSRTRPTPACHSRVLATRSPTLAAYCPGTRSRASPPARCRRRSSRAS